MQQATVNLFADMGVQPTTMQPGLVPATESTDTIAPTSRVVFPANGATIRSGVPITITGVAVDAGGGLSAASSVNRRRHDLASGHGARVELQLDTWRSRDRDD
jgi:hypothetical protein